MSQAAQIINDIKRSLERIQPLKVILFGSRALGGESPESDIDLLVILDTDDIPLNYEQKMKNRLLVRKCIYHLSKKMPIDLLVYTKGEYEIIKKNSNSFFREMAATGKVLYEKAG